MTEKCNVACSIGIAAEELRPRLRKRYTKEAFEEYLRQAVFEQNSYEKKDMAEKGGRIFTEPKMHCAYFICEPYDTEAKFFVYIDSPQMPWDEPTCCTEKVARAFLSRWVMQLGLNDSTTIDEIRDMVVLVSGFIADEILSPTKSH